MNSERIVPRLRRVAILVLVALCWLPSAEPVTAAGAGDVEFQIGGTLWRFPCATCTTPIAGTGTGAGNAQALIGGVAYNATFTILAGAVGGTVDYTEQGPPLCPALGSASNFGASRITLSGGATGVVYRSSTPTYTGAVTNVTVTLGFTYQRVGATALVAITGGTVTVSYYFPGTGSGSFNNTIVAGAAPAVFVVDPLIAASRCTNPGPLNFTLIGNAAIVTS